MSLYACCTRSVEHVLCVYKYPSLLCTVSEWVSKWCEDVTVKCWLLALGPIQAHTQTRIVCVHIDLAWTRKGHNTGLAKYSTSGLFTNYWFWDQMWILVCRLKLNWFQDKSTHRIFTPFNNAECCYIPKYVVSVKCWTQGCYCELPNPGSDTVL